MAYSHVTYWPFLFSVVGYLPEPVCCLSVAVTVFYGEDLFTLGVVANQPNIGNDATALRVFTLLTIVSGEIGRSVISMMLSGGIGFLGISTILVISPDRYNRHL